MDAVSGKILAVQGRTRFMVSAGTGDAHGAAGATDVALAYVYDLPSDSLSEEPWPVVSLAARGYWESTDDLADAYLADIAERAATALSRRPQSP